MRNKNSRVSDPNSFFTHIGEKFHNIYESRFDSNGRIKLSVSGRKNIKDEINSHAAECDMSVIINKLQYGDTSVLTSKQAMYGDFTQFPTTYADALDLVNRSEKAFQSLPTDIRSKFDNDKNKWFATIGTKTWFANMGFTPEDISPPSKPPSEPPSVRPSEGGVQ